jgi:hypothetical protein
MIFFFSGCLIFDCYGGVNLRKTMTVTVMEISVVGFSDFDEILTAAAFDDYFYDRVYGCRRHGVGGHLHRNHSRRNLSLFFFVYW